MDALLKGLAAGGLDGHQAIFADAVQDLDHLPVAVVAALQLASDRGHGRWQNPVLEWRPIAQSSRFACQNRHIVPGIIDGLVPPEGPLVLADDRVRHRARTDGASMAHPAG